MTSITVHAPRRVVAPRGALFAAWLFRRIASGLQAFNAAQERRLEQRLERQRLADSAEVRRYAHQMLSVDARFAADLFAAADRHTHVRN